MKIGDLVRYRSEYTSRLPLGEPAGLIIAKKKIYGKLYSSVLWSDGNIQLEDETSIELLKNNSNL